MIINIYIWILNLVCYYHKTDFLLERLRPFQLKKKEKLSCDPLQRSTHI